jgi:ArsR family transcriptional regulator
MAKCSGPRACARAVGVLADETRLKIVRALFAGGTCVAELAERAELPASRISHHLAILRAAGIVEGDRYGQRVIYRLSREFHGGRKSRTLDFGCCRVEFLPLEGGACEAGTEP